MNRTTATILQSALAFLGLGVFAFLLWEPHLEGRNAHATLFEIYFKDPFLAYAYLASIPFFVGLRQAFKALGYAGEEKAFSPEAVNALRTIKYCALALIGAVAGSLVFMLWEDPDDRPAGLFMRLLVTVPSIVVAVAAAKFERIARARSV